MNDLTNYQDGLALQPDLFKNLLPQDIPNVVGVIVIGGIASAAIAGVVSLLNGKQPA